MKALSSSKIALLVTLISFLVFSYKITLPFAGQHDWNSVFFGSAARNHIRFGLFTTKLGVVLSREYTPGVPLTYYTHHPILMPLLLASSFFLFGVTEWAGRLVPILSASMMIYFIFKLTDKLFSQKTAILTAFLLTFSPMLLYYSKVPIHETVVLGFLAASLWFYVKWIQDRSSRSFWWLLLGLILAQLTSWAGYYLSLYFPLHAFLFVSKKPSKFRKRLLVIFLLAPAMFAVHNLHSFWLTGSKAQTSLLDAFLFRLNLTSASQVFGFTYLNFIKLQARWIVIYFTRVMSILGLVWFGMLLKRKFSHKSITQGESIILLLFLFGFTHNAIFRNQAFIHDYTLIYALPFFAISSAVILSRLHTKLASKRYLATSAIVLILVFTATERLAYLRALFRSGDNNPGYTLGRALNKITSPNDKILVLNTEYMEFHDVFVNFYADRRISAVNQLADFNIESTDYVAIPASHDYVSDEDKNYLYSNFPHLSLNSGTIFDVRDKK